jgi:hypothetical protein
VHFIYEQVHVIKNIRITHVGLMYVLVRMESQALKGHQAYQGPMIVNGDFSFR